MTQAGTDELGTKAKINHNQHKLINHRMVMTGRDRRPWESINIELKGMLKINHKLKF
jgi:hypothetical protein